MNTTKRIVIEKEHHRIEALNKALSTMHPYMQSMVDEFNKLKIGVFKKDDFNRIFNESFINDKVVESIELPMAGGMKMRSDVFAKSFVMPVYYEFADSVKQIEKELDAYLNSEFSNKALLNYFTLENEVVSLDQNTINLFEERATIYAETPQQIEIFDSLKKVCDGLNELLKTGVYKYRFHSFPEFKLIIHGIKGVKLNRNEEKVIPDYVFIKRIA